MITAFKEKYGLLIVSWIIRFTQNASIHWIYHEYFIEVTDSEYCGQIETLSEWYGLHELWLLYSFSTNYGKCVCVCDFFSYYQIFEGDNANGLVKPLS